ncbi:MAG: ATP-grasp domain-containing protein [Acidobacteria bacterium]|nr:ATP-grasp domain-containing protein [Acidobacteriota bacterium]
MTARISPNDHESAGIDPEAPPRGSKKLVAVLVVPAESYRTTDFIAAARNLRVDLVVASDSDLPMSGLGVSRSLTIDCTRPEWSAARIARLRPRPDAVIAADDDGVITAAMAAIELGIPTSPIGAVTSTRDKIRMRGLLSNAEVPQPDYELARTGEVPAMAGALGYPCVVKPRDLSASRGVIRIDNDVDAERSERRVRAIVAGAGGAHDATLLVERFVLGPEVAVEGMLTNGHLTVLAILDKPDPLDGPYFEETMFVTPSRHGTNLQAEIKSVTAAATRALGLVSGPIHAELRCGPGGVVLIEIAARSIGGLCGRALSFGLLGESLESVIIRAALGMPGAGLDSSVPATGVLMIPIPIAGTLESIEGTDDALAVKGITEFSQTIANGKTVVPLPEGDRYLGFLFARGPDADTVEKTLRTAQAALTVTVTPD